MAKSPIVAALGLDLDEDSGDKDTDEDEDTEGETLGDALLALYDAMQRGDGKRAARAFKVATDLCAAEKGEGY